MKNNNWILYISAFVIGFIVFAEKKYQISSTLFNLAKKTTYDELFKKYASRYGLDWKMLKAIALNESSLGLNKGLEPKGGTVGLMQIKLSTARDYFKNLSDLDMYKDEIQVMSASAFLADLKKQFNGDIKKIVMSYNQGAGATRLGRTYALPYWEKYQKHLQAIG